VVVSRSAGGKAAGAQHLLAGLPGELPDRRWAAGQRKDRSARVLRGLDDLGDNDLGDAVGVLLAGVAVLAEFGAQVAGYDVGWVR
jgi:hypothetical protein